MYLCMKRATVSARRQSHPVGGCAVLEVQTYSSTVRAVPPTASDAVHRRARVVYGRRPGRFGVSKFAVDYAVRHQDECFVCSLFARWRLKIAKISGPMIARGLSGKAGESSHRRRGRFARSSTAHRLEDKSCQKRWTVAPAPLPKPVRRQHTIRLA